jgi:hypothetical protein
MMDNDLRLPFEAEILGMTVIVEGIDITDDDQLVAVCRKDKTKQRISLSELPLPSPLPKGAKWIVRIDTGEPARFDENKGQKTRGGPFRPPEHQPTQGRARGCRPYLAGWNRRDAA